jgi:hypothetical protein
MAAKTTKPGWFARLLSRGTGSGNLVRRPAQDLVYFALGSPRWFSEPNGSKPSDFFLSL